MELRPQQRMPHHRALHSASHNLDVCIAERGRKPRSTAESNALLGPSPTPLATKMSKA